MILRISAIGDVITTLPAALKLRTLAPGARLGWIVQKKAAQILQDQPWIDDLFVLEDNFWHIDHLPATLKLLREINQIGWNLIIDFQANEKSLMLRMLLSGTQLGAHSRHARSLLGGIFLNHQVPLYTPHVGTQNIELVDTFADIFDIRTDFYRQESAHSLFQLNPGATANIAAWIDENNLTESGYILLAPNTTWPSKHWPTEHWVELIAAFQDKYTNQNGPCPVLIGVHLGGQAAEIAASLPASILIAPRWNLQEVAAAEKSAALVIAPDTALLHLADFLGTSTIGLFGPTSALRNGPWVTPRNGEYTLQADCPHHHRKDHGTVDCMARISVAEVLETTQTVLQNTQPLSLPSFFSQTQQENNIVAR